MDIKEIENLVSKFRNVKNEKIFTYAQMFQSYEKYAQNIQGRKVRFGMKEIDNLLGMVRPSQLVTIIGATNVGKTTLAMHICYHNSVAMRDKLIIMFNLEIDENEILERTLCTEFDICSFDVENAFIKNDTEQLEKFQKVADKYNNFISVIGRVDIHDIIPYSLAIQELQGKEIGLILIDYLGLLKNKNHPKDEYLRVSDNVQKLKEVAMHLQVPVIDISQTSRADVKNTDKKLNLYSAKSSGEVENSSQIVIVVNKFTSKEELLKEQVCNQLIEEVEQGKIYILEAKIEKKKQGNFGKEILVQERKNLRIHSAQVYLDNNQIAF